jgi:hypothetical protein
VFNTQKLGINLAWLKDILGEQRPTPNQWRINMANRIATDIKNAHTEIAELVHNEMILRNRTIKTKKA